MAMAFERDPSSPDDLYVDIEAVNSIRSLAEAAPGSSRPSLCSRFSVGALAVVVS